MKLKSLILVAFFSGLLTACGGGGGGGSPTNSTDSSSGSSGSSSLSSRSSSSSSSSTPPASYANAGSFDPLVGTAIGGAIVDIKVVDLNNDGIDELVVAGRQSMGNPFTSLTHQAFQVQIYGWNADPTRLTNETSTWFPASGSNIITGTEPSIRFGNLTGRVDGLKDIYMAGGTDNGDVPAQSVIYKNNGDRSFTRIDITNSGWSHGSAVGDINEDGIDDAVNSNYSCSGCSLTTVLGGTTPTTLNTGFFGDAVTIGKFVSTDTRKYAIPTGSIIAGTLGNWQMWRFNPTLSAWDVVLTNVTDSSGVTTPDLHVIRIETVQLNNDALDDFVVVARPNSAGSWGAATEISYVMFFKNLDGGNFERTGVYIKNDALYYNVEVRDVNGDSINDIMLSSQIGNSTVLLGKRVNSDIVYVESGTSMFAEFETEIAVSGWHNGVSATNIMKGPYNAPYVVGIQRISDNEWNLPFKAIVDTVNVVRVEATVSEITQLWKQLTTAEAQAIVSR